MLADDFAKQLIAQQGFRQHARRLALKALAAMRARPPLQLVADAFDDHRLNVKHRPPAHARTAQRTAAVRTLRAQFDPADFVCLSSSAGPAPVTGMALLRAALLGALVRLAI